MKNKKSFFKGALTGALAVLLIMSMVSCGIKLPGTSKTSKKSSSTSVSYTHLDVYKRQHVKCSNTQPQIEFDCEQQGDTLEISTTDDIKVFNRMKDKMCIRDRNRLLAELMKLARDVIVTVTIDCLLYTSLDG